MNKVKPGESQGSILVLSIISFKYINDLSGNLKGNAILFADNTSVSSVVSDPISTSQNLNNNLDKVGP